MFGLEYSTGCLGAGLKDICETPNMGARISSHTEPSSSPTVLALYVMSHTDLFLLVYACMQRNQGNFQSFFHLISPRD